MAKNTLCGIEMNKENIKFVINHTPQRYKDDHIILKKCVEDGFNGCSNLVRNYFYVSIINSVYSTRMGPEYCYSMAKILSDKNEDVKIILNDYAPEQLQKLVDKCKEMKEDTQNSDVEAVHYSFLTKYFSTFKRYSKGNDGDGYPIYDGYVHRMLRMYAQKGMYIKKLTNSELRDYAKFFTEMKKLKDIADVKFYELDNFLWYYGKMLEETGADILKEKNPGKHRYYYVCHIDKLDSFADKIGIKNSDKILEMLVKGANAKLENRFDVKNLVSEYF